MPFDNTRGKVERLMRTLIRNSLEESIFWDVTADDDAFRLASPSANVRIEKSENFHPDQERSFTKRTLSIYNNKGRLVEEYIPQDHSQVDEFDELFNLARRSACSTDSVLDQLLKEIEKE